MGGFLSAQIMVLWALFCEYVLFDGEGIKKPMRKVQTALSAMGVPHLYLYSWAAANLSLGYCAAQTPRFLCPLRYERVV